MFCLPAARGLICVLARRARLGRRAHAFFILYLGAGILPDVFWPSDMAPNTTKMAPLPKQDPICLMHAWLSIDSDTMQGMLCSNALTKVCGPFNSG